MDKQRTSSSISAGSADSSGDSRNSGGRSGRMLPYAWTAIAALALGACASETAVAQLDQPGLIQDANAAIRCPHGTAVAAGQTQGRLSAVWCEKPDGRRHGPYLEWWENHQKKSAGMYQDGVRHGVWSFFLMNGQRDSQVEYRNGEAVSPPAAAPTPPR